MHTDDQAKDQKKENIVKIEKKVENKIYKSPAVESHTPLKQMSDYADKSSELPGI